MEWTKAVIGTNSGDVEMLTALLADYGIEGVEIEDEFETAQFLKNNKYRWDYVDEGLLSAEKGAARVIFYVSAGERGDETLNAVRGALSELKLFVDVETVNDEDWLYEWKKHYKPFKLGENIVIRPVWEEYVPKAGELVYTIDPGSVFGTGLHQSTQMCVEALEKVVKRGDCVLDIGCGSGILAVVALLLGAKRAMATDIEPAAAFQAEQNAELNGFSDDELTVLNGDIITDENMLKAVSGRLYDVVTANIVADAVIKLSPLVARLIEPGGVFISSGIIRDKTEQVRAALVANGFEVVDEKRKDEWVCLAGKRL